VVVPVKGGPEAKSRLSVDDAVRGSLAAAFAHDTIEAVLGCPEVAEVVVLTGDDATAAAVESQWRDVGVARQRPSDDLNAALTHVVAQLRAGSAPASVAVVAGDLPALTGSGLAAVLAAATTAGRPACVPDTAGLGTTALLMPHGTWVDPSFGPDSAARHRLAGAAVAAARAEVRRDVDTAADLAEARSLGVGPRTQWVLREVLGNLPSVQATVRSFDERSGNGTVLLDDGVELPFDAAAFDASGLRLLRLGQRVRIETDGDGHRVTSLTILTLA